MERLLVISQLIDPSYRPGMNQSAHFLLEGYVSDVLLLLLLPTFLSKYAICMNQRVLFVVVSDLFEVLHGVSD